jgi:hypothetical protein
MHVDIEVVAAVAGVLAKEALSVSLVNCSLQLDLLVPKLASDVDVGGLGSHRETHQK